MSKSINSKVTGTVTLSDGDNPVSVSSSGYVYGAPIGIDGPSGTVWTIANAGTILGQGTVTSGEAAGIVLGQGGLVTNQTGGFISGYSAGVYISGSAAGTIVNDGTVAGTSTNGDGADFNNSDGVVSNAGTGLISGSYGGVYFIGNTTGIVANYGTLRGNSGFGVQMGNGGAITNGASGGGNPAEIFGGSYGINIIAGANATVTNFGTITTPGKTGINLGPGGGVTNGDSATATATIYGKAYGIFAQLDAGTITNFGSIIGATSAGVRLGSGGDIANAVSGTIIGGIDGIHAVGATVTVDNAGAITGSSEAVVFGTGVNRLVDRPGAVFSGGVVAGGAASSNTLELASGASAGTLIGLGSSVTNFGSIQFDSGADWFIAGSTAGLSGTISGFARGDTIELSGVTASNPSYSGGVLTLDVSGGGTVTLDMTGPFTGETFVANAVLSGTDVSLACFAAGTRIATERGMVAVESLREGDRVRTLLDGKLRPVVWLGHRRVDCKRHPDPAQVWPICVSADAFGPGRPYRDLWLSPSHAVFVDGVLIPVCHLLNGRTIFQQARDSITYWHVELSEHTVLSAEGVPAESYLDTGNRSAFENGGPVMDLHPDFAWGVWDSQGCAPLVLEGPRLAVVKRRMLERACALGHVMTDEPALSVLADGRKIAATPVGRTWRVRLPEATRTVRLVSRVWSPAHVRYDTDDLRSLGVAISRLWLDRCEVALDAAALSSGWHAREADWRWTDGDASVAVGGARGLEFELAMTGTYWREAERGERRAAA